MNFLSDECTYYSTVRLLQRLNHNVITLKDLNLLATEDNKVVNTAKKLERIFVIRDLDFSNIINYPPNNYYGIIVLRIGAQNEEQVHNVFVNYINNKTQQHFVGKIFIISKDKVRIRD